MTQNSTVKKRVEAVKVVTVDTGVELRAAGFVKGFESRDAAEDYVIEHAAALSQLLGATSLIIAQYERNELGEYVSGFRTVA